VDGILKDWTLTAEGGDLYRLTKPDGGGPLPYGTFGDLLVLDFPDPIPAGGALVSFAVTDPVYDSMDSQGKYFVCPDTVRVSSLGSFAPAFPTPGITVTSPPNETHIIDFGNTLTSAQLELRNIGGSHTPTGVWLNWEVTDLPQFLAVDTTTGMLVSTTETDAITVTLDRSSPSGFYSTFFNIAFDANLLGGEPFNVPILVLMTIQNPLLQVTSTYFTPGAYVLDFGSTDDTQSFDVSNAGQSTLHWRVDTTAFPDWLNLTPNSGLAVLGDKNQVTVLMNRTGLASGTYTYDFIVQSDGGAQTITATMVVP
jgi:hypothetical protein